MLLSFSYAATLGSGHKPQVVHMPDNGFRIIYVNNEGLVKQADWP